MFNWLREYLEIRTEFRERRTRLTKEVNRENEICQSCETLKELLIQANSEKMMILNKLVNPPVSAPPIETGAPAISIPKTTLPWRIKQQMMEQEDRKKAQLLRDAPKPVSEKPTQEEIKEFERELDNASASRENQKSS